MGTISTGTGLYSGLDFHSIVDALVTNQKLEIQKLQKRIDGFNSRQAAMGVIESAVLSMASSATSLGQSSVFGSFKLTNTDTNQLTVTTTDSSSTGSFSFKALQRASTHSVRSTGFANALQKPGVGTVTVSSGRRLNEPTLLDALNNGNGVSRGTIRITDRSGATADVDLSSTYTVSDVVDAINSVTTISVTATMQGDRLALTDTTGPTANDLSAVDRNNGQAASDLGIAGSVSQATLTGSSVYNVSGHFALSQLNDENKIQQIAGVADFRITLTDDSTLDVNLDDATTLNDVLVAINDNADNGGRVTASLSNGRLVLGDNTGGRVSSPLAVTNLNTANVVHQLGLDETAVGTTLTGDHLLSDMGSVLVRNLRGGQGIDQLGQISLTDRTGATATIDVLNAHSLDAILRAINGAEDAGTPLQLVAEVDSTGTGIVIRDTSGATASNLIIADVGGSTTATQLGIAVDDATAEVASGSLSLRHVNDATELATYAPDGGPVASGSFQITDSAGNKAVINIGSSVTSLGGVIQRINSSSDISVTAQLNETGDGFELIDTAGGAGTMSVSEIGSTTAADLRILGTAVAGKINSRLTAVVEITADDTLQDVADKLNKYSGIVKASVVDDGSAFNATRLILTSAQSGYAGRLTIDDGGLGLGFKKMTNGQDALLRVGDSVENSLVIASDTNTFTKTAAGVNVTVNQITGNTAVVQVSRDSSPLKSALKGLVTQYNSFIDTVKSSTKYDLANNSRGVLQGETIVLRVNSRLDSILTSSYGAGNNTFRSLADVGIRVTTDGKLSFDSTKVDDAFNSNSSELTEFFTDLTEGFSKRFKDTLTSFSDPYSGTFITDKEASQASIDATQKRIDQLNILLEAKKTRLLTQFSQMESALSSLNGQQQALASLGVIASSSK